MEIIQWHLDVTFKKTAIPLWIKENGLWDEEMKKLYIDKKNKNDNPDMHSRAIFAMTIHEICQKIGFYEEEK